VLDTCSVLAEPLSQVFPTQTSCLLAAGHQDADELPTLGPGRALLVPGLGQRKLDKGRWLVYLSVEGAAWIAFDHARWSKTDERRQC
jgi:hypothetical protein